MRTILCALAYLTDLVAIALLLVVVAASAGTITETITHLFLK